MFVMISADEAKAIGILTIAGVEIVDSTNWPTGNGAFWVNLAENAKIIMERTGIDLTKRLVYTEEEARANTTWIYG